MTTFGFIGAGAMAQNLAETAIRHGHDATLSNSRGPESLAALIAHLGPHARADTPEGVARASEIVVVATPYSAIGDLPAEALAGKIVIDLTNYSRQRDGAIPELESGETTSTALLQRLLPTSHVIKAFQQIHAPQIVSDAQPSGAPDRRALAVFGDDPAARARVEKLIDEFGFDPVDAGELSESWRLERGAPGWDVRDTEPELRAHLAEATRRHGV